MFTIAPMTRQSYSAHTKDMPTAKIIIAKIIIVQYISSKGLNTRSSGSPHCYISYLDNELENKLQKKQ